MPTLPKCFLSLLVHIVSLTSVAALHKVDNIKTFMRCNKTLENVS